MNYKDISPVQFKEMTENNPSAVIIDCRTAPELLEFKLKYDYHIDIMLPNFNAKISELDKNMQYYIYCRSGSRSAYLCDFMARQGFNDLYNLAGGVIEWKNVFK